MSSSVSFYFVVIALVVLGGARAQSNQQLRDICLNTKQSTQTIRGATCSVACGFDGDMEPVFSFLCSNVPNTGNLNN